MENPESDLCQVIVHYLTTELTKLIKSCFLCRNQTEKTYSKKKKNQLYIHCFSFSKKCTILHT